MYDCLLYILVRDILGIKKADDVANESEERQRWGSKSLDKENKTVSISTNLLQVRKLRYKIFIALKQLNLTVINYKSNLKYTKFFHIRLRTS